MVNRFENLFVEVDPKQPYYKNGSSADENF